MMIKRKQTRNIVIALMGFILTAMGCGVLIQHIQLQKIQYHWSVKKKIMDDLKAEIDVVEGWIKQFEKERNDFSARLFSDADLPVLMDDLSICAKENALQVVDVKQGAFGPFRVLPVENNLKKTKVVAGRKPESASDQTAAEPPKVVDLVSMPVRLQVKGDFSSMMKFLECVRRNQRLLNVADIKIQSTPQYPVLDGQITLTLYGINTLAKEKQK